MRRTRSRAVVAVIVAAGLVTASTTGLTRAPVADAAPPAAPRAELAPDDAARAAQSVDPGALASGLRAEALELSAFEVQGGNVSFSVAPSAVESSSAPQTRAQSSAASTTSTEVTLDLADATSELRVRTDPADPASTATLDLTVHEATAELVAFTISDRATGETVEYRSDEAYPSFVPAIPIGIAIGAAAWKALAATAAVIVIGGLAYTAYEKIIEAVRANNQYQHYAVVLRSGGLFLGKGLGFSEAVTWGKGGSDTWSKSQAGARQIAQGVKDGRAPVGPEIDAQGSGKFWHYHPNNRAPAMHAFYGGPRG